MNVKKNNQVKTGYALLVALLICCVSCIKDTGNYIYHDVNSVEIGGINNVYIRELSAPLKINPVLNFSVGEDASVFEYQWHRIGAVNESTTTGSFTSRGIVSREKNLDIIIGAPWFTVSGRYDMLFCVFNRTTGVRYSHRFSLDIQDKMLIGYVMLCETKENFDLDLISLKDDTLTQYHNVLDLMNSKIPREGATPWDVVSYSDHASPTLAQDGLKNHALWILTDKSSERVRVENFEWKPEFNISGISMVLDKFLPEGEKLTARKMNAQRHTESDCQNWIYDKQGNWYWFNWAVLTNFCIHPINRTRGSEEPYKAAPFIFGNPGACAVLFNEDANRFEVQSSNPMGSTAAMMYTSPLTGQAIFDWQNPNYRLMYMDNKSRTEGFAVVRNVQTSRYEYLEWVVSGDGKTSPDKNNRKDFPLDDSVPFDDFEHFALHTQTPYLFCATENKLYRIDVNMMPLTGWVDVTHQVLPEGHLFSKVISSVKFPRSNMIVVCTYDLFGEKGQNGRLALYNVEHGTGNLTLAKHPSEPTANGYQIDMEWDGFGKIIGVDYRNVR